MLASVLGWGTRAPSPKEVPSGVDSPASVTAEIRPPGFPTPEGQSTDVSEVASCPSCIEPSRACLSPFQEELPLRLIGEDQDRPSVGFAAAAQGLVAVVPVLEEVLAVAV